MDASATGRLEWCTAVCSLVLIAISLFLFIIFVNVRRPFTEEGCGVRLPAVQMPITRENQVWDFFGFRSSRCGKSRIRVLVDLALVSYSLNDQYVQYSVKRGLQCGLQTPQLFGLGKGV